MRWHEMTQLDIARRALYMYLVVQFGFDLIFTQFLEVQFTAMPVQFVCFLKDKGMARL